MFQCDSADYFSLSRTSINALATLLEVFLKFFLPDTHTQTYRHEGNTLPLLTCACGVIRTITAHHTRMSCNPPHDSRSPGVQTWPPQRQAWEPACWRRLYMPPNLRDKTQNLRGTKCTWGWTTIIFRELRATATALLILHHSLANNSSAYKPCIATAYDGFGVPFTWHANKHPPCFIPTVCKLTQVLSPGLATH